MEAFCTRCGRPRTAGSRFCTGCGARFPGPATEQAAQPARAAPVRGRFSPGPYPSAVVVVAAAVAIAAAALGGWQFAVHLTSHGTQKEAGGKLTPAAAVHSTASPSPTPSPAAVSPDPAPSQPQSVGDVTISTDAAQNQAATGVAQFLDQYFTAINNHDYQSYISLLSPQSQQGFTAAQFSSGYRTTVDSAETLTGISTADNGDLQADVSFTSHQDPADSVDGTQSCTDWTISLFLEQNGSSYLIDPPPSSYQSSHTACQ